MFVLHEGILRGDHPFLGTRYARVSRRQQSILTLVVLDTWLIDSGGAVQCTSVVSESARALDDVEKYLNAATRAIFNGCQLT